MRASYCSEEPSEDEYDDYEDSENESFIEQDEGIKEIKRKYRVPKNIWIVKPGENTNRG